MKRKVKHGYEFVTRPLYPRWRVLVFVEPWFLGMKRARLDHRYQVNGKWEWLSCDLEMGDLSRRELAILVGAMRSDILATKQQEKSA